MWGGGGGARQLSGRGVGVGWQFYSVCAACPGKVLGAQHRAEEGAARWGSSLHAEEKPGRWEAGGEGMGLCPPPREESTAGGYLDRRCSGNLS